MKLSYVLKNIAKKLDDSGWKELNTSIVYRKKHGVVYISGVSAAQITLTAQTWTTVATLPEGYRPNREIRIASDTAGATAPAVVAHVTAAGLIRVWANQQINYWGISGSFPVGGGS